MNVFFRRHSVLLGHQSVGQNLIDGIRSNCPELSIYTYDSGLGANTKPGLYSTRIGENGDPVSKIDHFFRILQSRDTLFDYAAMKLCYVDIHACTDIYSLFSHYKSGIDELKISRPKLTIIHITVPLRVIYLGIRSRLKLLSGQRITAIEDNINREKYNDLIRSEYNGRGALFDLALHEATDLNGNLTTLQYRNEHIRTLNKIYSDDGGHLNSAGMSEIAARFSGFLEEM